MMNNKSLRCDTKTCFNTEINGRLVVSVICCVRKGQAG